MGYYLLVFRRSMKLDSVNLPDTKDSKKRNVRNTGENGRSLIVTSLHRHKSSFNQNKFKSPTSPACDCFETSCHQQSHQKVSASRSDDEIMINNILLIASKR